jgi:hypothetical protein
MTGGRHGARCQRRIPRRQFYLPREVQVEITNRSGNILLTELFKTAYLDVSRYVPRASVFIPDGPCTALIGRD